MNIRLLQRNEIPLIWQIDCREIVQNIYYLGHPELFVLEPEDIHLEYVI